MIYDEDRPVVRNFGVDRLIKACRVERYCAYCGGKIKVGMGAVRSVYLVDGEFKTHYTHVVKDCLGEW